jgi:integrase
MDDVERDVCRRGLMDGTRSPLRVGTVGPSGDTAAPFEVRDANGDVVEPVGVWLRELVVCDLSPRTVRAYCYALLTWFRVLWLLDVGWEQATESETAAMVGWFRLAANPQRNRRVGTAPAGSVNVATGKPSLSAGYCPSTVNLTLAAVRNFYGFHARWGRGPVANPVPASSQRRQVLAHRSPLEPSPSFRRGRYRQRSIDAVPRSIADDRWAALVGALCSDRDRALLECFVSSGARAVELLGARLADVDWQAQRLWVVSKGSRSRRMAPLSPDALATLARYLPSVIADGPATGRALWWTERSPRRELTYPAARRVLQRANEQLGTNWSLHDLRHTAAARMIGSGVLTLVEVQVLLGHADVRTTTRYTLPRVEELCLRLQAFYATPRPSAARFTGDYDPADLAVVFGPSAAGTV